MELFIEYSTKCLTIQCGKTLQAFKQIVIKAISLIVGGFFTFPCRLVLLGKI